MTLKAYNNTASLKSYLSSVITIAANDSTIIPIEQQYALAQDGNFRNDCITSAVYLNNGYTDLNYVNNDALDFLDRILAQNSTLIGASDGTRIGNDGDQLKVVQSPSLSHQMDFNMTNGLLRELITQMRILNTHVSHITDIENLEEEPGDHPL